MPYCQNCAAEVSAQAAYCSHCGKPQASGAYDSPAPPPPSSPATTRPAGRKFWIAVAALAALVLLAIVPKKAPDGAPKQFGSDAAAIAVAQAAASEKLKSSSQVKFGAASAERRSDRSFLVYGKGEGMNSFGGFAKFEFVAAVDFDCAEWSCGKAANVAIRE